MVKALIVAGFVLLGIGLVMTFGERLPLHLGRLPGDIYIQVRNSSFYFPITTCLLISAVVSLVMWLFGRR